jgi:hypothetical protein
MATAFLLVLSAVFVSFGEDDAGEEDAPDIT